MKLSQRLNRTFIFLLMFVILASALTSILTFNSSLMHYIDNERDDEFSRISEDIVSIIETNSPLTNSLLENYVSKNNISLRYYDINDNLVSSFNSIENYENIDPKSLAEKRYILNNEANQKIGYLEISYIDNIFVYDNSVKEFQTDIIRKYAYIFLLSVLFASCLIIFISKTITDPITEIQDQTKKIRNRNYNTKNNLYNIYELDELSSDINYLSSTLQMQENYRSDYARDIAHELRTPMSNLLLHLEGIKDDIIEPDDETISLLISEVKRLNKLIDKLETSFNKSEEELEINLENINLSTLLDSIISSFRPQLEEKNINLVKEYNDDINIITDKDKMTQILSNLISNAIKAIDNNDGEIKLTIDEFKNRTVINISDNGVGIKEEDQSKIFDRFYRVDSVRNTKVGGHGLGLSITKNFIDLLNYNISLNSTENEGSEFIITIPINKKNQDA